MNRIRLVLLALILTTISGIAAIRSWPTPEQRTNLAFDVLLWAECLPLPGYLERERLEWLADVNDDGMGSSQWSDNSTH